MGHDSNVFFQFEGPVWLVISSREALQKSTSATWSPAALPLGQMNRLSSPPLCAWRMTLVSHSGADMIDGQNA